MKNISSRSFQTGAVHAGERVPGEEYTPVTTPISTSVGYVYESMDDMDAVFAGQKQGYVYSRYSSPTVAAFEEAVASLEEAEAAQAYSSGMAAIHAALLGSGVKAGVMVVAAMDVYGATFTLLRGLLTTLGVTVRMVEVTDPAEVESALKETEAVCLLAETISNPLLKVADIPTLAGLAHRYGASLLVDNTFASPYLFNPLFSGADYAVHSATKYISGHGDVLGGVIATSAANKKGAIRIEQNGRGHARAVRGLFGFARVEDAPITNGTAVQECAASGRVASETSTRKECQFSRTPRSSSTCPGRDAF
jgi:cystathionine beta-lyase/cystathionine gamma-synthase